MPVYGYARVSSDGQALDAQIAQLRAAGAEKVFREKISGARADRPELSRLLRKLAPGDRVLVTRLDRLARSTRDLLNTLAGLVRARLGRYHDPARRADAEGAGGLGRVRARTNPSAHRRGTRAREGTGGTARTQAKAQPAPAERGTGPARRRRARHRDRAIVRRASRHHLAPAIMAEQARHDRASPAEGA